VPQKSFFAFFIGIYLLVGLLPVLIMAGESFFVHGHFSLTLYSDIVHSSKKIELFLKTVLLGVSVTLLTSFFGIVLGVLLEKTNLLFRHLLLALFTLPLLLPPYIVALAWSSLFGEWFFGFWGVVFVEFSIYLPIPLLSTVILLKMINPKLEDAARLFLPWRKVLRYITLPLVVPSVLLVSVLVFLLSFGNYSVVNFLRFNTIVVESFVQYSAFYNYTASYALSFLFISFVIVLLIIERIYNEKKSYQGLFEHFRFQNSNRIDLGVYKIPLSLLLIVAALFLILFPIAVLVVESASLHIYLEAFHIAKESMLRTLLYAAFGGFSITFFGFIIAYATRHKLFRFIWSLDAITLFLFAIPSTLLGMAMVLFFNHSWSNFIYATSLIIIISYTIKYSAISNRIFLANMQQIPPSMEESAQMLGFSMFARIRYITVPLLSGAFIFSYLLSFIFLLRDTDITMLLYSAGYDTLAIRTFTMMANSPKDIIAALSVIMICMVGVPFAIIFLSMLRKKNDSY
jgi:iron(III) transport system permease protein